MGVGGGKEGMGRETAQGWDDEDEEDEKHLNLIRFIKIHVATTLIVRYMLMNKDIQMSMHCHMFRG